MREASATQLKAFGEALAAQLGPGRGRTTWLAQQVGKELGEPGVTPTAVKAWLDGQSEPTRARVFALERIFRLRGGTLSRLLGYLPADAQPAKSVADAIDADDKLDERARDALLGLYRTLREG